MTFEELLKLPVERIETGKGAWIILGERHGHVPEIKHKHEISYDKFKEQDKIKVHIIKDFCFDGRRVFQVFSVTFEDKLVMICRRAGREGDDSYGTAIFDKDTYDLMVVYINTMRYHQLEDEEEFTPDLLTDDAGLFEENYSTHIVNGPFEYER